MANLGTLQTLGAKKRAYTSVLPVIAASAGAPTSRMKIIKRAHSRYIAYTLGSFADGVSGGVSLLTRYQLGSISGTVSENGTPVANARVMAFERVTGVCLASARTNSYGQFALPAMFDKLSSDHFVVALDPDGGVMYNALIFDRLTPV